MPPDAGEFRALLQELYLQELTLAVYGVYIRRLRDQGGRRILEDYLEREAERRRRIGDHLARAGQASGAGPGCLFRSVGTAYGLVTALLGSRVMLRIALSASKRASRRACEGVGPADRPDLVYLGTLRARSEADLRDELQQHLIDTRGARSGS